MPPRMIARYERAPCPVCGNERRSPAAISSVVSPSAGLPLPIQGTHPGPAIAIRTARSAVSDGPRTVNSRTGSSASLPTSALARRAERASTGPDCAIPKRPPMWRPPSTTRSSSPGSSTRRTGRSGSTGSSGRASRFGTSPSSGSKRTVSPSAIRPRRCPLCAPGQRAHGQRRARTVLELTVREVADGAARRADRDRGAGVRALDRRAAGRGADDARDRGGRPPLVPAHRTGRTLVPCNRGRHRGRPHG